MATLWSLAWAARQPRVSRVAQRRTPTTGMVGTRLGAEVKGSPGGAEPAEEGTGRRDISLLHLPPPWWGYKAPPPDLPILPFITCRHTASPREGWEPALGRAQLNPALQAGGVGGRN